MVDYENAHLQCTYYNSSAWWDGRGLMLLEDASVVCRVNIWFHKASVPAGMPGAAGDRKGRVVIDYAKPACHKRLRHQI